MSSAMSSPVMLAGIPVNSSDVRRHGPKVMGSDQDGADRTGVPGSSRHSNRPCTKACSEKLVSTEWSSMKSPPQRGVTSTTPPGEI